MGIPAIDGPPEGIGGGGPGGGACIWFLGEIITAELVDDDGTSGGNIRFPVRSTLMGDTVAAEFRGLTCVELCAELRPEGPCCTAAGDGPLVSRSGVVAELDGLVGFAELADGGGGGAVAVAMLFNAMSLALTANR